MSTDPSTTLWAVYVTGMGDYHACASRRLAARNATWGNLSAVKALPELDNDLYPLVYQAPVPWPYDAESHAEDLAKRDRDPRWSDVDADVIGELARHEHAGYEDGMPPSDVPDGHIVIPEPYFGFKAKGETDAERARKVADDIEGNYLPGSNSREGTARLLRSAADAMERAAQVPA